MTERERMLLERTFREWWKMDCRFGMMEHEAVRSFFDRAAKAVQEAQAPLDGGVTEGNKLLQTVLDYYEGRPPYRFRHSPDGGGSDAFDAWQVIAQQIRSHLKSALTNG